MTYQSTWWYPNYVEYGCGLNAPKTWPNVKEQYRRPDQVYDLRHYDLPVEGTTDRLYYEMPRLGRPQYRATFRDKPFTLARHYPGEDPNGKPIGYFGRVYYEQGPPPFKYDGPKLDKLYWLERSPYLPSFPKSTSAPVGPPNERDNSMRDIDTALNRATGSDRNSRGSHSAPLGVQIPPPGRSGGSSRMGSRSTKVVRSSFKPVYQPGTMSQTIYTTSYNHPSKRLTQDGVGFL